MQEELSYLERSVWEKSISHAIEELLVKKNIKSPIEAFQVGKLQSSLSKKIEEVAKIEIEDAGIVMDKHTLLHIREERKGQYNQALRVEEILEIPLVLQEAESVVFDSVNKNIIFWFDDKRDEKMINKIVVQLNRKIKKFGVSNYTVTVGKIDRILSEKSKEYVRIL